MSGGAISARGPRLAGPLLVTAGLCLLLLLAALLVGRHAPAPAALAGLVGLEGGSPLDRRILRALRLPRAMGVAAAGASLGAAGYLLQVALRNRLAEPQLLALNAGASLAMVLVTAFALPLPGVLGPSLAASLGAGLLFGLVLLLSTLARGSAEPARLIFCGVAVTALAHSLSSAILLMSSETLEQLRFWLIGDGAAARSALVLGALPLQIAGFAIGLLALPSLAVLALGDGLARGLGASAGGARLAAVLAAACLTGGAVSEVGPIGFVGLVTPLMWRGLLARPRGAALVLMALSGAALLLAADLVARHAFYPRELPTGAITGLVGAAAFLLLFRRGATA